MNQARSHFRHARARSLFVLKDSKRITDANPQHKEYKWGRRVLFDFKNKDGVRLQGIVALPDDYQTGEKRPMLVTFYEKSSQGMHRYSSRRTSPGCYNGKKAVLLAYPGEGHGLRGMANRRDLTVRYFEFFDHYLKDAPAPKWLSEGVPFLKKNDKPESASK